MLTAGAGGQYKIRAVRIFTDKQDEIQTLQRRQPRGRLRSEAEGRAARL